MYIPKFKHLALGASTIGLTIYHMLSVAVLIFAVIALVTFLKSFLTNHGFFYNKHWK